MKKERKDDSFIKQPFYKGGETALRDFLSNNLKYPTISLADKIEGDVHVRYDIDYKGNVIDAKVISGLDKACNEEAIRVVKLLKFEVPKNPRKLRVTFHKSIRIHFHAPKTAQVSTVSEPNLSSGQVSVQMSYNIVSTRAETPKQPSNEKKIYTYSIEVPGS